MDGHQLAVVMTFLSLWLGESAEACSDNCTCLSRPDRYEMFCAPSKMQNMWSDYEMKMSVSNDVLNLDCRGDVNASNVYHWTSRRKSAWNTRLDKVKFVTIANCPLPADGAPLKEMIGFGNIIKLNIMSCKGQALQRTHFAGMGASLTYLLLTDSSIEKLPDDVFAELGPALKVLDLQQNSLLDIPSKSLAPLKGLKYLELGNNNLGVLKNGTFENLTSLTFLNLWKNENLQLLSGSFAGLRNLTSLDLTNCNLGSLPDGVFSDLSGLQNLSMVATNLTILPDKLFPPTSNLTVLKFFRNRRTLERVPSGLLANLKNLKEVYFYSNNITELPEDFISGSGNITVLELQENQLKVLPKLLLKSASELKKLDLSQNNLSSLPDGLFESTNKLQTINLSFNKIGYLQKGVFHGLHSVTSLFLSNNNISVIEPHSFPHTSSVRTLDLSNNNLQDVAATEFDDGFGGKSVFEVLHKLEILNLSHNHIYKTYSDWKLSSLQLQELDLSYNNFSALTTDDLQFLQSNITVDLRHSNISKINLKLLETMASQNQNSSPRIKILVGGNTVDCGCPGYYFLRYVDGSALPAAYKLIDIDTNGANCIGTQRPVKEVSSHSVICDDTCCPNPWKCKIRAWDKARIMECDGCWIDGKSPPIPKNCTKVNHTEVYLHHNEFHTIPEEVLNLQPYITSLRLSHNSLTEVDPRALSPSLKELELDNNSLKTLSDEVIELMANRTALLRISLNSNPWECNCQAKNFLQFLQNNYEKVVHRIDIKCKNGQKLTGMTNDELCPLLKIMLTISSISLPVIAISLGIIAFLYYRYQRTTNIWMYSNQLQMWFVTERNVNRGKVYNVFFTHLQDDEESALERSPTGLEGGAKVDSRTNITCENGYQLVDMTNDELCPLRKMTIIISSVSIGIIGISLGVIGFLYYRYQEDIKIWLYARSLCLWFVTEEELDKDKVYDAFVSYSHKDEEFVVEQLVAGLENGPIPFKLCLHYRDWVAGDWISEQIARSVERSRRTLVVLSPNFLDSVWGKMEFRAAHRKALSDGLARVIVVMYGDVGDVEKLDPELKSYLSTNTYVKWGDPWFWDKLRYALPHTAKKCVGKKKINTDKLELIVPGSPNPLSTPVDNIVNPMEKQLNGHVKCYENSVFIAQ